MFKTRFIDVQEPWKAILIQAAWDHMGGDERMNREIMMRGIPVMKVGYKLKTRTIKKLWNPYSVKLIGGLQYGS